MTERTLPAVAFAVPARSAGSRSAQPAEAPDATRRPAQAGTAVKRKETFLNTPARAGMLLGASAAMYAATLAGVSAFQSQSDAALAAAHQPYADALAQRQAANDRLEASLATLDDRLAALGGSYAATGQSVATYASRLDALAALVTTMQGTAAAAPTRINLPTVTVTRTTASSSSSSGSTSTTAAAKTTPAAVAAPAAAAPPPTTATTAASGKPKP